MKSFYERNSYLLEHEVNKTFEEVLWMSMKNSDNVRDMRKEVAYSWDELAYHQELGSEDKIIDQFNQMSSFNVRDFECYNEETNEKDVIRNISCSNAANQCFLR